MGPRPEYDAEPAIEAQRDDTTGHFRGREAFAAVRRTTRLEDA